MSLDLQGIICLCGNDGTGKSTLAKLIPMLSPKFHVIERSSPQPLSYFESLRQEIKKIDFLTYRYSFEEERGNFEPSSSITTSEGDELPVYWIMLHLEP
jgi:ATPase subunit of ABC transporter with duplicated ATPase domains